MTAGDGEAWIVELANAGEGAAGSDPAAAREALADIERSGLESLTVREDA